MKRGIIYLLIALSLALPDISYGGRQRPAFRSPGKYLERKIIHRTAKDLGTAMPYFNRTLTRVKDFGNKISEPDRECSEKNSQRAREIAGGIFGGVYGVPFANQAIEGINRLNESTGYYNQQRK